MDLRQMLSTVEFTESRRGADRNEVASFLREVARGVAGLERQVAEATSRAEKAEQHLRDTGSDDELRRTLLLAQRTADATVADAHEEGERITQAAEERAGRLLGEAEAHGEQSRADTAAIAAAALAANTAHLAELKRQGEAEVRGSTEELRLRLRDDVASLTARRGQLNDDVRALEDHVAAQRRRIESALKTLQFLIDNPAALAALDPPEMAPLEPLMLEGDEPEPEPAPVAEAEPTAVAQKPAVVDLTDSTESAAAEENEPEIPVVDDVPSLGWDENVPVVGEGAGSSHPITAEVPVVAKTGSAGRPVNKVIIDVRDDEIDDHALGRPGGSSHDDRRRRFGRVR